MIDNPKTALRELLHMLAELGYSSYKLFAWDGNWACLYLFCHKNQIDSLFHRC
ncbi:MAG: hypothetical protein HW399_1109 [Dehalococcoidia bacterium]|nr:hypothetical protein [Dehalococcoidia bacterium]